jgi:hypothetical protein
MNKAPRTLGIYLCKRIAVDPAIGEMSLVGLFSAMSFDRFLHQFSVSPCTRCCTMEPAREHSKCG